MATRKRVHHPNITAGQRRALLESYRESGNMTAAMRAAGIASYATAYLWWHRYEAEGEAGLQPRSHARKTQPTLEERKPELARQISELRREHPEYGRVQIAQRLALAHEGQQVVSPGGVERVLRRAGLWREKPRRSGKKGGLLTVPTDRE